MRCSRAPFAVIGLVFGIAGSGCGYQPPIPSDVLVRPILADDPITRQVLRYGGHRLGPHFSVQLGFTLAPDDRSWVKTLVGGPRVHDAAMAFDPRSGHLIIHGGEATSGLEEATYTWDRARWTVHSDQVNGPGPRLMPLIYFDEDEQRFILYGGSETLSLDEIDGDRDFDEWRWLGDRWALRKEGAPGSGPVTIAASGVYDRARRVAVMVETSPEGEMRTWERGTEGWKLVARGGLTPRSPRQVAYDSKRARTVVYGGLRLPLLDRSQLPTDPAEYLTDTWSWDGRTWTQIATEGPHRDAGALGYDELHDRIILTGGIAYDCPRLLNVCGSTWAFDGARWTELISEEDAAGR
jgi:hypothetical protein